jgi:single-stranded-DNA-specific exonuclease
MMDRREERKWLFPDVPDDEAKALALARGLTVPTARVLLARGIVGDRTIEKFLAPALSQMSDPFRLPDMSKAVDLILEHVANGSTILVYGDFDADGITATALMIRALSKLGAMVVPFLPRRIEDGYGLSVKTLRRAVAQTRPQLVVTVDCGTDSADAAEEAAALGIDLVITDHHVPDPEHIAHPVALVNPKLAEDEDTYMLAGVGVAFKLVQALAERARTRGLPQAEELRAEDFLDLVAVGTVADMVPLLRENRILVHYGLDLINRSPAPWLKAMSKYCELKFGDVDSFAIGYVLAPRINAVGRIGDPDVALELMLSDSNDTRADALAQNLERAGSRRQEIEDCIYSEATRYLEKHFVPSRDFVILLASKSWHPGVIGVVASRIAARYNRPTVILSAVANGKTRGSARSIPGFPLLDHLMQCREYLNHCGGHAMAAGIELDSENLEPFARKLQELSSRTLGGQDMRRILAIDSVLTPAELSIEQYRSQLILRPYGHSNPYPVWATMGAVMLARPAIFRGRHVKTAFRIGDRKFDAVGFNMSYRNFPDVGTRLDIAYNILPNRYRPEQIVLHLHDFHVHG